MNITIVDINDTDLFNGVLVRNIKNGLIRRIKVLPKYKTISMCVKEGLFNINEEIDYETFRLNYTRYELVKEDENDTSDSSKSVLDSLISLYNIHKVKLNNLKENRSLSDVENWTDVEIASVDSQITILASILSDINKVLLSYEDKNYSLDGVNKTYIDWLTSRIEMTEIEKNTTNDTNLIVGKDAKLTAYKEVLNYIKTHN